MSFWAGRRVLLTGHTGFKGAWAARWLARRGARVTGIALAPDPGPSLHDILGTAHLEASHIADLRDAATTARLVARAEPEIVLHMAAQPLVRLSYADPVGTFATNVMGTVHLLEALRHHARPRVVLVVTSDKVYANDGAGRAFVESDRIGGHDPYSASKAATEIVVAAFRQSYFEDLGTRLVTARGGNVIGGGDFAADRLVPDILRALSQDRVPELRNPQATRPWQHVLDCLDGYFTYAAALAEGRALPAALNFGPAAGTPSASVADLTDGLLRAMGRAPVFSETPGDGPVEMTQLAIDAREAARSLGWRPRLGPEATLALTAAWYGAYLEGAGMGALTDAQIETYEALAAPETQP